MKNFDSVFCVVRHSLKVPLSTFNPHPSPTFPKANKPLRSESLHMKHSILLGLGPVKSIELFLQCDETINNRLVSRRQHLREENPCQSRGAIKELDR